MAHSHNDSPFDDTVSHSSGEEGASDTACGGDEEEFVRPQKRRRLSYEPQERVSACNTVRPSPVQPVNVSANVNNHIKFPVPQVSMLEQARMYNKFAMPLPRPFIKQEPITSSYHLAAPFPVYAQPQASQFVTLNTPHIAAEEYYVSCIPAAPSPVPCYASYVNDYAGDAQFLMSEQVSAAPLECFDAYFPTTEAYPSASYQSGSIDIFGMWRDAPINSFSPNVLYLFFYYTKFTNMKKKNKKKIIL